MKIPLSKFLEILSENKSHSIVIDYEIDTENLSLKDFPSHINTLILKNSARFSQWTGLLTAKNGPINILSLDNLSEKTTKLKETLLHENCTVTGIGMTNLSPKLVEIIMSTVSAEKNCISRFLLGWLPDETMKIVVSSFINQNVNVEWIGIEYLQSEFQNPILKHKKDSFFPGKREFSVMFLPQYDLAWLPESSPRVQIDGPCVLTIKQNSDFEMEDARFEITLSQNDIFIQSLKLSDDHGLANIVLSRMQKYCIENVILDGVSISATVQVVSAITKTKFNINNLTWAPDSLAQESINMIQRVQASILRKQAEDVRQRYGLVAQISGNPDKRKEAPPGVALNGKSEESPSQKKKY